MNTIEWDYGNAFLLGSVVTFDVSTKTHRNVWATVDADDWPAVRQSRWRAKRQKALFYVFHSKKGKTIFLHRFLTDFKWPVVDHIDGNGLNNCRSNLQRCETNAENITAAFDRIRGCSKADALLEKWIARNERVRTS